MALRKIVTVGDPILTKVCRPVTKFDQKLAILIEDMIETMHDANGVGLAGPQVGILRRVVVVDAGDEDIELVNPEVVEVSEETQTGLEGCLSLPGIHEPVKRPTRIRVKYQDEDFQEHEEWVEGYLARVMQHEFDHLDAHLFVDRLTPLRKQMVRTKLGQMLKGKFRCSYKVKCPK